MFDVGFWELVIIAAVALLVAGPEKLPGIVRDGGRLLARLRRFVMQTKYEMERELRLDEQKNFDGRLGDLDKLMDIAPDNPSSSSPSSPTPSPASEPKTPGSTKAQTPQNTAAQDTD